MFGLCPQVEALVRLAQVQQFKGIVNEVKSNVVRTLWANPGIGVILPVPFYV